MIDYAFEGWQDRLVPIEQIEPHPDNPNEGDVEAIVESVIVNGCYRPVWVSRRSNRIVGGTHLYLAHLQVGASHVPVDWVTCRDDEHELRILIVDNELTRKGIYIEPILIESLQRLKDTPVGLAGTGFDRGALERLVENEKRPLDLTTLIRDPEALHHRTRCPECKHVFVPKPI